jgi:hypothetical protein
MQEGAFMTDFIKEIKKIKASMVVVGKTLIEDIPVQVIFNALLLSYEHL